MGPYHPVGKPLGLTVSRSGLAKKTQTYFFFKINDARVHDFRTQLAKLVPLITTTVQAMSNRAKIAESKKSAASDKAGIPHLKISGINIAFSHKGLVKVGRTA